ncbi:CAMK family protein kinase [Histomonas meleagridis]|uniref:CAMK family protein kinase n=1 Tax=Histomonas meleagridis TaxID=135588 RepID=UPI00355A83C4|nr:CAMK family protein kinase [Histomonas meleagridis]KAH0799228.1 CAMK family protein kinase [Histomonas meleagridis]
MGCFQSGALKKVTQEPMIFGPSSAKKETLNTQRNIEENNQIQKNVCSFSTFVQQNENPTIFEWTFLNEIAKGSMSRVFISKNIETGIKCAAKVYDKELLMRPTLGGEAPPYIAVQRELDIMASISHRYIIPIIEIIEDDYTNSLIMLLPYANKGSLQSYIDSEHPSEETLSICFYEIAESLRYLHSHNIVHRDIKPENILIFTDTLFKLSDFSVSSKLDEPDQKLIDTRGSPAFLSPEECEDDAFDPKRADVWAYGITLFSCIFHFLPFRLELGQGRNVVSTVFTVTHLLSTEELDVPEDKGFSPHLIALLKNILQKDPNKRPSFEEIVKSEWFKKGKEIDKEMLENEEEEEEEMKEN